MWRCPKWSWLAEFSEMNAVLCNKSQTLIGGRSNQELIKGNQTKKVIKLYAIRQSN